MIYIQAWSESGGISFGGYRILKDYDVIYETEVGLSTSNVSCFLGICHALHKFPNETIYTNNQTALSWIKKNKVNSDCESLIERIEKAEKYLESLDNKKVEYKKLK